MKRNLMLLAAGLVASVTFAISLTGCDSAPTLTAQQQVTIACAAINSEVSTLQVSGIFTGGAQDTLTKQVQPDVARVCTAGAAVTTANLQSIVDDALPAVQTIVNNSTLSERDKNAATLAIGAASATVSVAIAFQAGAVTSTSAASAPVVASTPLAGAAVQ
jgi:hypothetical protein